MPFLVDSHCHLDRLDLTPFGGSFEAMLEASARLDVRHMLCVCIGVENFAEVLSYAERYSNVHASVGKHPDDLDGVEPSLDELIAWGSHPRVIAVGETGLDYFRQKGDLTWQQNRFRRHIQASIALKKPLIIHTREASIDTLQILREEGASRGVFHCFTESLEVAEAAIDLGFYISFSGIVTFKNAKALQAVAAQLPLERILVETDAPYLTPDPYRGKPNFPGNTHYVARCLAELKGIEYARLALATTTNFETLFGVKVS